MMKCPAEQCMPVAILSYTFLLKIRRHGLVLSLNIQQMTKLVLSDERASTSSLGHFTTHKSHQSRLCSRQGTFMLLIIGALFFVWLRQG
jgi:hypothetical protein